MSDWERQPGLACEFCGRPGHLIPIAPRLSAVAYVTEASAMDANARVETRITCPEHRRLVVERALRESDPAEYAYRHGRPDEWGETGPERMRKALNKVLDRLDDAGVAEAKEIRREAHRKGMI